MEDPDGGQWTYMGSHVWSSRNLFSHHCGLCLYLLGTKALKEEIILGSQDQASGSYALAHGSLCVIGIILGRPNDNTFSSLFRCIHWIGWGIVVVGSATMCEAWSQSPVSRTWGTLIVIVDLLHTCVGRGSPKVLRWPLRMGMLFLPHTLSWKKKPWLSFILLILWWTRRSNYFNLTSNTQILNGMMGQRDKIS